MYSYVVSIPLRTDWGAVVGGTCDCGRSLVVRCLLGQSLPMMIAYSRLVPSVQKRLVDLELLIPSLGTTESVQDLIAQKLDRYKE